MKNILGRGKKSPPDLVKSTIKNINILKNAKKSAEEKGDQESSPNAKHNTKNEQAQAKAKASLTQNLSQMRVILYGNVDHDADPKQIKKLVSAIFEGETNDMLWELLDSILLIDFEARRDVPQIWNFLLRKEASHAEAYIKKNPKVLDKLVDGYNEPDVALSCGKILREVIQSEALNDMLLHDPQRFNQFFDFVQLPTFDISSDAFTTFKEMLTKHKKTCAAFMAKNFDDMFGRYNKLLLSENYVTKRRSLKLLSELLLTRANFEIMTKYVNSADNLKIIMTLLKGKTKTVQFEAFHVFKIFVANPKKSAPVSKILFHNKDALIGFLSKLQKEQDDERFDNEKKLLLRKMEELELPEPTTTTTTTTTTATTATATTSTTTDERAVTTTDDKATATTTATTATTTTDDKAATITTDDKAAATTATEAPETQPETTVTDGTPS